MNKLKLLLIILLGIFSIVFCASNYKLVTNVSELNKAIKSAEPGDNIVLANGIWNNVQLQLNCSGTKESPIVIRSETPGKVFIEGESYIKFGGDYVIVDGLHFRNGHTPEKSVIQFGINREIVANNCKVINCVIEDFNQPHRDRPDHWVEFWGRNNTLEKCYIAGKSNQGPTIRIEIKGNKSIKNYHKIINNHFGPRPRKGGPRGETIQLGDSETSMSPSYTLVAENYFERCNGEVEVISSKTNFNEFRNNIFYKSEGSLVMRHGNYCVIDGNFFIGEENSNNIGGIRIINTGHWITNNYFFNLKGENFRAPLAVMNGIPKSPLNRYNQVTDVVVAYNTWINCKSPLQFGIGSNVDQKDVLPKSEIRSARPIRTVVANNVIYNEMKDNQIIVAHDELNGIKFKNNYIDNGGVKNFDFEGLEITSIKMDKQSESFYVPMSGLEDLKLYNGFEFELITMDILGNSRENKNSPGAVCKSNYKIFEMFETKNYGPDWYSVLDNGNTPQKIKVENNNIDINYVLKQAENGDTLIFSGGIFNIAKSLVIDKKITLMPFDENENVVFNYFGEKETPLFELNPKGDLSLIKINLSGNKSQFAFASLKENMSSLYNLSVTDSKVSNFNYVLKAYKESFSDEITFKNMKIINCENGIELSEEINDKGDYNVEFLIIDNCTFENVKKNVVDYYRGGYDESTIGGNLTIKNSVFTNCGSDEVKGILINNRGIINVDISNNTFKNNNVKLVALLWGAKNNSHSNNEIINSGKIVVEENIKLKIIY